MAPSVPFTPTSAGVNQPDEYTGPFFPPRLLPSARTALAAAQRHLDLARQPRDCATRFVHAHLAALRAAAAVVAQHGLGNQRGRRRPRSVWELLPIAEPRLTAWSARFTDSAAKRSAAEAGLPGAVVGAEAAELLADAVAFVAVVEQLLGVSEPQEHLTEG